jgi:hypothetical protein
MPSRGQQLGKLLNSSGDIVETSLPPKIETFSQSVSNSGKIEASALGDDVSTIEQVSDTNSLSASGNTVGDQRVVGNALYIWNGSGWYRIALINESPTWDSGGQPSTSYILDADSPQDATVITLAASDPDGLPIQYSYVTGGSMDSMATIIQDSSVFTITPKTVEQVGEGVELTGSITFRASDGVNILPQVSSFTLNFISVVENSRYTTLLATAVDTSDNNNITDSSTNNHTITVTGDAHAGTFSPYRHGGYSTYFDGSGDDLTIADHTSFDFGTSDFTIETWFYLASDDGTYTICAQFSAGNTGGIWLGRWTSGFVFRQGGVADVITASSPPSANQWHHVAVSRSSGSTRMFIDGTQVGSTVTSDTNNYSVSAPMHIGSDGDPTDNQKLNGYLSDFRIVKGTGLYTSNFTPTTERLTTVSGTGYSTSLLTCHLPYIADGSSSAHSITVNGDTSTKAFGPYDYTEYSESTNGGSVYFDGNDYLSIAHSTDLDLGTGNFTIEGWWRFDDTSNQNLVSKYAGGQGFVVQYQSGNLRLVLGLGGSDAVYSFSWTPVAGTWYHVCILRDGTNGKAFINGTQIGSTTTVSTSNVGTTGTLQIGLTHTVSEYTRGHVSDVRIVKGTAVYTANFTPPTAPLTAITNTSLLLKSTDASIIDKSQGSNLKLVGNTTGSTTQVKFTGSKSIYVPSAGVFDANTANCVRIDEVVLTNTESFTYEFWMKLSSTTYNASPYGHTDQNRQTQWNEGGVTGKIMLYMDGYIHQTTGCYSAAEASDWMHVAYSFDQPAGGNNFKLFINGTQRVATFLGTWIYINTIGAGYAGYNAPINGYLQDFRVTKGLARYTSNFTPPTESLKG